MNLRKTAKFSGITELTEMFEFGGILESAEMFEFGGIVQIWRKFRNLWKKNPFYRILELAEIWNWRKTAASSGILDLAEIFVFGRILEPAELFKFGGNFVICGNKSILQKFRIGGNLELAENGCI